MRLIPLFLVVLGVAEIAAFVTVAGAIGVLKAILLLIATSLVGALLLRSQGLGVLERLRGEAAARRNPGRELAHGAMVVVAGALLILPGFVTDAIGLLLFIPPVRDLAWRLLRARISWLASARVFRPGAGPRHDPGVIDLDADSYRAEPPRGSSPWRRLDPR